MSMCIQFIYKTVEWYTVDCADLQCKLERDTKMHCKFVNKEEGFIHLKQRMHFTVCSMNSEHNLNSSLES